MSVGKLLSTFLYSLWYAVTVQAALNIPMCPKYSEAVTVNNTIVCKCLTNHFSRLDNNKLICEPCININCSAGFGRSHDCNNAVHYNKSETITCIKCSLGYFSKLNKCRKCRQDCGINEIESLPCKLGDDRICTCKSGFYRNLLTYLCDQKCNICNGNKTEDFVQNHECNGLPLHMRCKQNASITTTKLIQHSKTKEGEYVTGFPTEIKNFSLNPTVKIVEQTATLPKFQDSMKRFPGAMVAVIVIVVLALAVIVFIAYRKRCVRHVPYTRTTTPIHIDIDVNEKELLHSRLSDIPDHWLNSTLLTSCTTGMGIQIGFTFENHHSAMKLMQNMCKLIFGAESHVQEIHKFQSFFMHIITRRSDFTFLQFINILQHPDVDRLDVVDVVLSIIENQIASNDQKANVSSIQIEEDNRVVFSNGDSSSNTEEYLVCIDH